MTVAPNLDTGSAKRPRRRRITAASTSEPNALARRRRAGAFNLRALDYYPRLRRVRDRLEQAIARPLSTAAAASLAGLNPCYFSTFFHAKVGMRFSEWSRQVRIERAMVILRSEDCPIGQVVRRVGYTGPRAFQRAFKRHTSMTPSQFRRGSCRR